MSLAQRQRLVEELPKCELHVHIEGCITPAMMLEMAERNSMTDEVPFKSESEAQAMFEYENLQQFLDLRDASLQVLRTEKDFYEVMVSYLDTAASQNVLHSEIFFDPQVHTLRGIGFEVFMPGFIKGMQYCQKRISATLLMCFMTELGPQDAELVLEQAEPYMQYISGVGIARGIPNWKGERYPHSSFAAIFRKCAELGLKLTAHAAEEGPPTEVWEAINELKVDRIDHGVGSLLDKKLLQHLQDTRLPLTVCPLSNYKLKVFKGEYVGRMRELIAWKLCTTVNSDDPPFFGGYINENFTFWMEELDLSIEELKQLAYNSVEASFQSKEQKQLYKKAVENCQPAPLEGY